MRDLVHAVRPGVAIITLCFVVAVPATALVLENFSLDAGRTEDNRIIAPVFDAAGMPSVHFSAFSFEPDRSQHVVYRILTESLLGSSPRFKKPRYVLEAGTQLEEHLTEALRTEAKAMGFDASETASAGWRVGGTIHKLAVELRTSGGGWGPYLFFGHLDATFTVQRENEPAVQHRWQHFDMSHIYNAGFGAQDEAREALARFLLSAAQEIVARLNRHHFNAPPHPSVLSLLEGLGSEDDRFENSVLRVGLSGDPAAEPLLLQMLRDERDEADRANIVNALANLGQPGTFDELSSRYDGEDEDVRLFILKAMSYHGGERASDFILTKGTADKNLPVRVLASRYSP